MSTRAPRGSALVVGLIVLSLVTLLALAGASSAHVERLLAQNETFRENAAFAASAGIEMAISAILDSARSRDREHARDRTHVRRGTGSKPRCDSSATRLRCRRRPARVSAAHISKSSARAHAARRAIDRQRAGVLWVVAVRRARRGQRLRTDCRPALPPARRARAALLAARAHRMTTRNHPARQADSRSPKCSRRWSWSRCWPPSPSRSGAITCCGCGARRRFRRCWRCRPSRTATSAFTPVTPTRRR